MQAQCPLPEAELSDENTDTVVIRPRGGGRKFQKMLTPLLVAILLLEIVGLWFAVQMHDLGLASITCLLLAVIIPAMIWCAKQPDGPVIVLLPQGFSVDIATPFLGTVAIPWEEITSVTPRRFLGNASLLIALKSKAPLKARLGKAATFLWMYEIPGGLGIPCASFGLSPDDLAARINRYRERGL